MVRMTYQKNNGDIIQKIVNSSDYKKGDIMTWGWKVLNKEYFYKGKYYSYEDYNMILERDLTRCVKRNSVKKKIYHIYRELIYCVILFTFIKGFEMMLKINM